MKVPNFYTSEEEYHVIRTIYAIFSDWTETFFLGFSDLPNNEMTNTLYVCDSVILWLIQLCHHFSVEILSNQHQFWYTYSSMQYLEMFFFRIFNYYGFYWLFQFLGLRAMFWGEIQTTSKSNFYGFYRVNGPF